MNKEKILIAALFLVVAAFKGHKKLIVHNHKLEDSTLKFFLMISSSKTLTNLRQDFNGLKTLPR